MSLDLGSLLQNQLGNVLGQFLTNNGEASDASSKAAGLAIPAVMAGLVKYVSNDGQHGGKLFEMLSGASGSTLTGVLNQTAHGTDYKSFINLVKVYCLACWAAVRRMHLMLLLAKAVFQKCLLAR